MRTISTYTLDITSHLPNYFKIKDKIDETIIYFINNYLMIYNHTIKDNVTIYRQYYSLDQNDLDIKQLEQLYLLRVHEFRVGELIIIRNRNLNINPIILSRVREEISRDNVSWK